MNVFKAVILKNFKKRYIYGKINLDLKLKEKLLTKIHLSTRKLLKREKN